MGKAELALIGLVCLGAGFAIMLAVAYVFYRKEQKLGVKNFLIAAIAGGVTTLIAMQLATFLVPDLRPSNPPVTNTVQWDSPETQALWNRACGDCHSNETVWPWYSYFAPGSWLVTHDVLDGRKKLNISEVIKKSGEDMAEQVQRGKMPMDIYVLMHPEANLSDAEKQQLIAGLQATFGGQEFEHGDRNNNNNTVGGGNDQNNPGIITVEGGSDNDSDSN